MASPPKQEYDFVSATLDPQDVCSWLGIEGNYLGHEVSTTIGAPTEPPKKRGQKAKYSPRAAILISNGGFFRDMGLTPHRVKACIQAILDNWEKVEPVGLDIDKGDFGNPDVQFLLGIEDPVRGFKAEVVDRKRLMLKLGIDMPGRLQDPRPLVIQNITALVAGHALSLFRHLRNRTQRPKQRRRRKA